MELLAAETVAMMGGDDAQLLGPGLRLFVAVFQLLFAEGHQELLLVGSPCFLF